ncbi:hypothetical protein [Kamptonema formosum]|nr:hypothetical protein [Oscillatoria sp. PCC 10802]
MTIERVVVNSFRLIILFKNSHRRATGDNHGGIVPTRRTQRVGKLY